MSWLKEGYGNLKDKGTVKIGFLSIKGHATRETTEIVRFLREQPLVVDRHPISAYGTTVNITCSGDDSCYACKDNQKLQENKGFYEVLTKDGDVLLFERGKKDLRKLKILQNKEGGLMGRPVEIIRVGKSMQDTEYTFSFVDGAKIKRPSDAKVAELLDGFVLEEYLKPQTAQEYDDLINERRKGDKESGGKKAGKSKDDKFTDMDRSSLKRYIAKNGLDMKVFKSMSDDDIRDGIRDCLS